MLIYRDESPPPPPPPPPRKLSAKLKDGTLSKKRQNKESAPSQGGTNLWSSASLRRTTKPIIRSTAASRARSLSPRLDHFQILLILLILIDQDCYSRDAQHEKLYQYNKEGFLLCKKDLNKKEELFESIMITPVKLHLQKNK